ncbi:hypothetical protein ON010_g9463 [Phytophthora cinnamomi]|nr:hypothetical protein ON010_g9463 [Phytophthora cinnamomi]
MAEVEVWEQGVGAGSPGNILTRKARPRKSVWKRVTEKWEAIQIENQGAYSIERLESLNLYCKTTSISRVVFFCVLSPIPALLTALVVESFPLRLPAEGWAANWVFWLRLFVMHTAIGIVMNSQIARLIPELNFPILKRAVVSLGMVIAFVATCLLFASTVGFPIPFMIQIGAIPRRIYGSLTTMAVLGPAIFAKNSPSKRQYDRYNRFYGPFVILSLSFPFYKVLYNLVPVAYRGVTVIILVIWKFSARHVIVRKTRALEDVMPVLVTLSVDFLSTLFIAVCVSTSRSVYLMLLFTGVNIGQLLFQFRAMSANGKALLKLLDAQRSSQTLTGKKLDVFTGSTNLLLIILDATQNSALLPPKSLEEVRLWACLPYPLTATILERLRVLDSSGVYRSRDDITSRWKYSSWGYEQDGRLSSIQRPASLRIRSASITPCAENSAAVVSLKTPPEQLAKHQTTQGRSHRSIKVVVQGVRLLFHSEFVTLVQYVEVIVPIVFLIFKSTLEHLPNVVYYPGGAGNWNMECVSNISLFAVMGIGLLLSFNTLLHRRFGFSPLYQLAFVLETEMWVVQAMLFNLMLLVLQYDLEHFGADFTFRFEWLRSKND